MYKFTVSVWHHILVLIITTGVLL